MPRPLLPLLALLALPMSPTAAPPQPAGTSAPDPAQQAPGMVMYNATHWELHQMAGEWSVTTTHSGERFHPLDTHARVWLVNRATGDVMEHDIPPVGELAFGHGWIVVNRMSRESF